MMRAGTSPRLHDVAPPPTALEEQWDDTALDVVPEVRRHPVSLKRSFIFVLLVEDKMTRVVLGSVDDEAEAPRFGSARRDVPAQDGGDLVAPAGLCLIVSDDGEHVAMMADRRKVIRGQGSLRDGR